MKLAGAVDVVAEGVERRIAASAHRAGRRWPRGGEQKTGEGNGNRKRAQAQADPPFRDSLVWVLGELCARRGNGRLPGERAERLERWSRLLEGRPSAPATAGRAEAAPAAAGAARAAGPCRSGKSRARPDRRRRRRRSGSRSSIGQRPAREAGRERGQRARRSRVGARPHSTTPQPRGCAGRILSGPDQDDRAGRRRDAAPGLDRHGEVLSRGDRGQVDRLEEDTA